MIRLIIMTDFTESFGYDLLRGILEYSRDTSPWAVKRMPPSYKSVHGMQAVIGCARQWEADAIIGRFETGDDIISFRKSGIVAMAQDFKTRFKEIPNITSDYIRTGRIAADFFLKKGFRNFGFYGYRNVCWSEERCEGFCGRLREKGVKSPIHIHTIGHLEDFWLYGPENLNEWLRNLPKPAAVFACDDTQASNLIETCRMTGIKVPEEIAVLGTDNDETTCGLTAPTLSSINLNVRKGGYEAASLIDRMVKEKIYEADDILIEATSVVERMSTAIYPSDNPYIVKILKYISQNITSKITIDDLLRQVPMSRRLLEIRFRQDTGQSIHQYITSMRMNLFAQKLLASDEPIADVASRIGLNDTRNLSRIFRQAKGCSPMEYRKRHK